MRRGSNLKLTIGVAVLFAAATAAAQEASKRAKNPVSYTHLTLPTIYSV